MATARSQSSPATTARSGARLQRAAGVWTSGAIAGGAAKSKPGLVAVGGGLLAVTRGAADTLQSVTATGTTWSAPAESASPA